MRHLSNMNILNKIGESYNKLAYTWYILTLVEQGDIDHKQLTKVIAKNRSSKNIYWIPIKLS